MQSLNKILIRPSTFIMITRSQSQHSNKVEHLASIEEFHMKVDNQIAKIEYTRKDNVLKLFHSFVPPDLRGKGIGHDLAKGTFELIGQNNLKMEITCLFIQRVYKENESKYKHLYAN